MASSSSDQQHDIIPFEDDVANLPLQALHPVMLLPPPPSWNPDAPSSSSKPKDISPPLSPCASTTSASPPASPPHSPISNPIPVNSDDDTPHRAFEPCHSRRPRTRSHTRPPTSSLPPKSPISSKKRKASVASSSKSQPKRAKPVVSIDITRAYSPMYFTKEIRDFARTTLYDRLMLAEELYTHPTYKVLGFRDWLKEKQMMFWATELTGYWPQLVGEFYANLSPDVVDPLSPWYGKVFVRGQLIDLPLLLSTRPFSSQNSMAKMKTHSRT